MNDKRLERLTTNDIFCIISSISRTVNTHVSGNVRQDGKYFNELKVLSQHPKIEFLLSIKSHGPPNHRAYQGFTPDGLQVYILVHELYLQLVRRVRASAPTSSSWSPSCSSSSLSPSPSAASSRWSRSDLSSLLLSQIIYFSNRQMAKVENIQCLNFYRFIAKVKNGVRIQWQRNGIDSQCRA